ncbi:MAG TPA: lysophospholipid acyltransferase family protein [Candidatus Kryptonia bacterium]|nr:lysophospholipid acyltransferase family protein [Candidatus Kryptonia bacterium]
MRGSGSVSGAIAQTRRTRGGDPLGFDQNTAERWLGYVHTALWPYFRPRVIGAEHLPAGRALVVGCHSGVIPYDAACTLVAIHQATGRYARAIGDKLFGRFGFVESFLRRQGALVGNPESVEAVMRAGHLLLLFPGGAKDMERPYLTQRYQVLPHRGFAPGHGGYIKIALRTHAPIVPLAIVGAEEAHVVLGNLPSVARMLGMPLFPLLLFGLPLPTKLYIRFGKPIVLAGTAADARDQRTVDRLNECIRQRVQRLIDDTVQRRHGVIFSEYRDGPIRTRDR